MKVNSSIVFLKYIYRLINILNWVLSDWFTQFLCMYGYFLIDSHYSPSAIYRFHHYSNHSNLLLTSTSISIIIYVYQL